MAELACAGTRNGSGNLDVHWVSVSALVVVQDHIVICVLQNVQDLLLGCGFRLQCLREWLDGHIRQLWLQAFAADRLLRFSCAVG